MQKLASKHMKLQAKVEENLQGTCFVHGFFKARQYAIIEEKIYKSLKYVSIKFAHLNF